jgi:hypothetical protein
MWLEGLVGSVNGIGPKHVQLMGGRAVGALLFRLWDLLQRPPRWALGNRRQSLQNHHLPCHSALLQIHQSPPLLALVLQNRRHLYHPAVKGRGSQRRFLLISRHLGPFLPNPVMGHLVSSGELVDGCLSRQALSPLALVVSREFLM